MKSTVEIALRELPEEIALRELVETETGRQHLGRLMTGEGTDLADDDVMQGAW